MKTFKILAFSFLLITALYSCKKEDVIGGSLFKAQVNMTTYDYLKTNHLFDTLVIMIDRMGLKDEVNSSGTFFALTNYSIHNYVTAKKTELEFERNDENLVYTFDSLDFSSLKDSLRAYMFKDKITLAAATSTGKLYTANDGEQRLVQGIQTTDYTSSLFTTEPKYLYLTKLVNTDQYTLPPVLDSTTLTQVDPSQYLQTLCQTEGIITTTGLLHVLSNDHTFTYYNNVNN